MVLDVVLSPAIETVAVILSPIIEALIEITIGAKNVFIEKESFAELVKYLERIVSLLKELMYKEIEVTSLNNVVDILRHEVKMAKELIEECGQKNRVYLLLNCRSIAKRLERITREISRALSLIPLSSLDLSLNRIAEIKGILDCMRNAEIKAARVEEEILQKIEFGIHERNFDSSYANNLLLKIADTVGISREPSSLRKEFEEFKKEIENVRIKKDHAEAMQMDQIIALLERADATSSLNEREIKYQSKRDSLGIQPLEPLRSFYCPITEDVMLDPVETSSGHTFERSAIEKWYAEGNNLCPMTLTPLDTSILRPNKTLRQSIEEWKDRNTMIKLVSMKSKLSSQGEEVDSCLEELQKICFERKIHQEWVLMENYIPILIGLLTDKSREIRHQALVILCMLARDNDDAKERIAGVNNAIESIVRFLGRSIRDAKVAVELLLELSKNELILEHIGKAQGCILLLVTLSSNNDGQASEDARQLLNKLSFSDQNIILMARSNYFEPLLLRLSSGPEDVRLTMVMTLAEMELTEFNRSSLFGRGVLSSLLNLILQDNSEMKKAAAKAIQNLSSLPRIGLQMIQEGVVPPLLGLLFLPSSPLELREDVAITIVNLAQATELSGTNDTEVTLFESDEDLYKLFSLISTRAPSIQHSVLQTFQAICCSPSASTIKNKLAQCIPELLPLCETDNRKVRASAIKLISCLTHNGNEFDGLEHMDEKTIKTILAIISSSDDKDEIVSALGIISNLPEQPHITESMVNLGTLSCIVRYLSNGSRHNGMHKEQLKENAVGALRHFSNSTNHLSQKRVAETGVIHLLVKLLESGTDLAKERAARCLAEFSKNSSQLSRQHHNSHGFALLFCCSSPSEQGCPVHRGICREESFCLVKTGAVGPLARVMEGSSHPGATEAALDALLTLIEGEKLQNGCKILAEANAIRPMIDLLGKNSSILQQKVLTSLERIFRIIEFKQRYGGSAQALLVDLTQRGDINTRQLAAKILAHLDVLHHQSSYF